MKKSLRIAIIAFAFIICAVVFAVWRISSIPFFTDSISTQKAEVSAYAIYGTHINMEIKLTANTKEEATGEYIYRLVFVDAGCFKRGYTPEQAQKFELISEVNPDGVITLKTGEYINSGINAEGILRGSYGVLLEQQESVISASGEEQQTFSYYTLENTTSYGALNYYTLTRNGENNLISIEFSPFSSNDASIKTLTLSCEQAALPEDVYDIVLEVGHGGDDPGACAYRKGKLIKESDLNIKMALLTKSYLEGYGYKVALTRTDDTDTSSYGAYGRATLCNTYHAKLSLSLHNNSSSDKKYCGVEIYIPNKTDKAFAKEIAQEIAAKTGSAYSNLPYYRLDEGVFCRLHTKADVAYEKAEAERLGFKLYDSFVPGTNYYFMLREVGGISTGAYMDGRNPDYEANPYYDSNSTAEAIIVEFGYMSNAENLSLLINEREKYCMALAQAVNAYYNEQYTPGEGANE